MTRALTSFASSIEDCRLCARLVEHREKVALTKCTPYRDQTYWGRPVAGFGDPDASLLVLGGVPEAHGANRTGRVFTGDRSGDFLYAALFRAALASQARAEHKDDGLTLRGVFITLPIRCVPPDDEPRDDELERCSVLLRQEIALLPGLKAALAIGPAAWFVATAIGGRGKLGPGFTHGARTTVTWGRRRIELLGSYHVSQQNMRRQLTAEMFDLVLADAKALAGL